MKPHILSSFVALVVASCAQAIDFETVIDVSGVSSVAGRGSSKNDVRDIAVSGLFPGFRNFRLIGLGWDISMTAFAPSLLSDMIISLRKTDDSDSVELAPGVNSTVSGQGNFASNGVIDLVGLGLDFELLPDESLRLEFYEFFDDFGNDADGVYGNSSLTLRFQASPVPEPQAWAAFGLAAMLVARRKGSAKL